jgi:hypothetical protein
MAEGQNYAMAARDVAMEYTDKRVDGLKAELLELIDKRQTKPAPARKGISLKAFRALPEAERKAFKFSMADRVSLMQGKFNELEEALLQVNKQVQEIKKKGLTYKGVFQRAMEYQRGDVVTHSGSAWVCVGDAGEGVPGDNSSWQLMAKGR